MNPSVTTLRNSGPTIDPTVNRGAAFSSLRRGALPRWPGVVFPAVMVAALAFAVVYLANRSILPPALAYAIAAGLGLVSGFAARWTLRHRASLVRGLAAVAALTIGLLLLGLITQGRAGVGSFASARSAPNWSGLAQLTLGAVASGLALRAWRPSARGMRQAPAATRLASIPAQRKRPTHGLPGRRVAGWWRRVGARAHARWRALNFRRPNQWLGQIARRMVHPVAPIGRSPIRSPRSARSTRRSRSLRIRLTGGNEDHCPFCLAPIEPNDLRGVVACPICRARHHADCWAVTGMCQVPHPHH